MNIILSMKLLVHLENLMQTRDSFIITIEEPVHFRYLNIKEKNKDHNSYWN